MRVQAYAADTCMTNRLTDAEMRLCREIESRRGQLLDDLRLHVALATGPGETGELDETRERLSARCMALGAELELVPGQPRPWWIGGPQAMRAKLAGASQGVIPPTAVLRRLGGKGEPGRGVLIAGHLDTVHDRAGAFRGLSVAPDGKTATGPGCVDMKGGLVIALAALEALEAVGCVVPWTVILNSDEETGSFHSDAALRREAASGRYCAGLALEPAMAGGELAIARGGSGQFMLEAHGKAAHVGRDFAAGISATDALARGIVAAHQASDPGRGLCVNISPLWCDQPTNQVADHAAAWGNVRYPDAQGEGELKGALAGIARGGAGELPRVEVHTAFSRPAKPQTPGVEALALRARGVAEDLGQRLGFARTAGVCDGNNLQSAGLPTIDTLGVRGGGLHTAQEWVEVGSLVERCQLLGVLVGRLGT